MILLRRDGYPSGGGDEALAVAEHVAPGGELGVDASCGTKHVLTVEK